MKIKERRLKVGLSQSKVASAVGLSRVQLSYYETGQREMSSEIEQRINDYYDSFYIDYNFDAKFDYIRIRFPTNKVATIISDVLQMEIDYFQTKETGLYGYNLLYALSNIRVLNSELGSDRGVLIELAGKGCRNYDAVLDEVESTWSAFFERCREYGGHATRIDIAMDDKVEAIRLDFLAEKVRNGEYLSKFRSNRVIDSSNMVNKSTAGVTVYFGSRQSLIHFCFYQKNHEMAKQLNIPLESVDVKNRYEIRMSNEKAEAFITHYLNDCDISKGIRSIIADYLTICDVDRRTGEIKIAKSWYNFLGHVTNVDLRLEPVEPTYITKLNWIKNQVGPTLKILSEVDRLKNTKVLDHIIEDTELKENDEKIINLELAEIRDYVV